MRLPDDRGPLEHLYSLHIPNCDKHGLYNLKQVSEGASLGREGPRSALLSCCACLLSRRLSRDAVFWNLSSL